jgi:Na+/H+ antiporter NhaD/arsenite permease-like protein
MALSDPGLALAMTCAIAALATIGVIARPWNMPEFVYALAGAALLVALRLLSWNEAAAAAAKGFDVYLFLIGMMLLSETLRAKRGCSIGSRRARQRRRAAQPVGCS